jgi:hypothetical protein
MSSTTKTIEKNIYAEERKGSVRFIVAVSPFPKDSRTCSMEDRAHGLQWARKRRLELLEQKHAANSAPSGKTTETRGLVRHPLTNKQAHPENTKLRDVLATYKRLKLQNLRRAANELSRLNRLDGWLGDHTLGELCYERVENWKNARLNGELGSGRSPSRKSSTLPEDQASSPTSAVAEVSTKQQKQAARKKNMSCPALEATSASVGQSALGSEKRAAAAGLTKQQKYDAKKKGVSFPPSGVFPASTKTVWHELVLLRRALKFFFEVHSMMLKFGLWLNNHRLMQMPLPDKSEPRKRRISDYEVSIILKHLPEQVRPVVLFAVLSGLRRSELLSLR